MSDRPYLDTLGLWEAAAALPEQLSSALDTRTRRLRRLGPPDAAAVRTVAAFGLGTGGTACEAAAALAAGHLRGAVLARPRPRGPGVRRTSTRWSSPCRARAAPTRRWRPPRPPRPAGRRSWPSGVTPMVRWRASPAAPRVRGVPPPAHPVHRGGPVPPDAAGPAALGAVTVPLLVALSRIGLVPDCGPSVDGRGRRARRAGATRSSWPGRRRAGAGPAHRADHPARLRLVRGAAVAARWWKAQVNLNAKAPAFAAALPELTYDELAGWGQGGDVTRQTMSLVLLRHAGEGAWAARPLRGRARRHRRGHGGRARRPRRGGRRPQPLLRPGALRAARLACTWPGTKASTPGRRRPSRRRTTPGRRAARLAQALG